MGKMSWEAAAAESTESSCSSHLLLNLLQSWCTHGERWLDIIHQVHFPVMNHIFPIIPTDLFWIWSTPCPFDGFQINLWMLPPWSFHWSSHCPTPFWHHCLAHLTDVIGFGSSVQMLRSIPFQIYALRIKASRHTSPNWWPLDQGLKDTITIWSSHCPPIL